MFISLSKTIGRVGGLRIGVGKRITSKNAWYMFLILAFVYTCQLMVYMCVVALWCVYAMCYGMWWLIKTMIMGIISMTKGGAAVASKAVAEKRISESPYYDTAHTTTSKRSSSEVSVNNLIQQPILTSYTEDSMADIANDYRFCSRCGKPITPGNSFCIACGKPIG